MTTAPPSLSSTRPPAAQVGAIAWLRKNLFSNWFSALLTVVLGLLLVRTSLGFLTWATTTAQWAVIPANLPLFFVGRYPVAQYWRIWAIVGILATLSGLSWGILSRNLAKLFDRNILIGFGVAAAIAVLIPAPIPYRILLLALLGLVLASAWIGRLVGQRMPQLGQWLSLGWGLSLLVVWWLIAGGIGLPGVRTNDWGGLMLTMFMSVTSILLCFPLGILLALGRQSKLPVLRWIAIAFIEVIRGVPLITLLFVGAYMVPLFLPGGIRLNQLLLAIISLTLFSAAYLAENVRGGLQSVPRGQAEAANALGLNSVLATILIVLPQALKVSIPTIVGQFISLVQDTTLVGLLGAFEMLGISRSILANPSFIGRYAEVYLFIGAIYWVLCYAMSLGSRRLEKQLNTTH
ncbi:MAG: amino acid ABC transporter permease [Drouetiella hepatica Uher 2000/2452]|jgi:general L-amino acid transport system permease protein|uniref:Amino acid ABC transporter permease n=1 Tax=Drouetiella hepatica Uher 2000/2452 TaxID=904376 RepID=A0A951UM25_9CYAN|nr:amino acid ABC transporter permease [Drouetiella hepatica Uher 2000/2452]